MTPLLGTKTSSAPVGAAPAGDRRAAGGGRGRTRLRSLFSWLPDRTPEAASVSSVAARYVELPDFSSQGGGAPEWVELLPAGPVVEGRDGRKWRLDDPERVAAESLDGSDPKKKEIPIDWEHATEIKAPQGEPAPAAGWITRLEVREGALWGRVEWTDRGREAVASREYRYLSPVFLHSKERAGTKNNNSPGRILRILSAGLTNSPNLALQALNHEGQGDRNTMDIKKILGALGLAEDAAVEQAVTAIDTLKQDRDSAEERARNIAGSPSLEKFVPRADYDAALELAKEKATNAEAKLAEHEAQALDKEIDAEIAKALEAGKITPATADYHRAQCRADGEGKSGLERFKEYVEAVPEVAGDSGLDGKQPDGGAAKALNAGEARIAAMFGNSAEDLKKYGASGAGGGKSA
ncbi:MAG: hypothetical protein OXB98_02570 [Bryobacterales bacterium]|nr:hypothetical protein [Bryobacterales bacterium]